MTDRARTDPELWGGVECTVNRVGDRYHDQSEFSGHDRRTDDLDRIAELGIRTLRYPIVWERHAPADPDRVNWAWADERMDRLRGLGVNPIVGLVHHGSGPRYAPIGTPAFAAGLAAFARRVAERYPWVEAYTPVNEPLTTARFCGLYGHWHPHGRDDRTFVRVLLSECRAVVLAMRAVRSVNPMARLVQTDDLGQTRSTPRLAYQADFDNERRWLTWDLLCGRVDRRHPLWAYLRRFGATAADLGWFGDNPCPPDVIGVNYYLTSERFIDDRLHRYPPHLHGGNGRHRYADTETVRVGELVGPARLLWQAWERYGRPLAVTECHLGGVPEEQMRWLWDVWRAARRVRRAGVDVRAVTVWSLLGAYDWDLLVTRVAGRYEPGVFDVRGGVPGPTPLADLVRDLATGREPTRPELADCGWWQQPERILHPVDDEQPQPCEIG